MTKFVFNKDEPNRIVSWPCKISVPQSGGKSEDQEITAKYRIVSTDKAAELARSGLGGDLSVLKEVLVGFVDLKDDAGEAVPDETAVQLLLSLPYAVRGLTQGYFDMLAGRLPKN